MSTVQERNSEMVEILSSDFVKRKDSTYQAGALAGAIMALPGIVSFWPMGVALDHISSMRFEEIVVGSVEKPAANLDVHRGTFPSGTAIFRGTTNITHFNYYENEDTYIRGGKSTSQVVIGDVGSGGVNIAAGGAPTIFGGRIGSVFTGFSFGSGWADFGGGNALGSYKKIGDIVLLRGLVTRVSGVAGLIGNLPAGFRPTAIELFDVHTDTGLGRVQVSTTGDMTLLSGGAGWVSLAGKLFSTL